MKKVILKQLILKNWRGMKDLVVDFKEKETTITGGNDTGKSTIFNAFNWLLTGKDVLDRENYRIRPIIDGELLRRVDCEVDALLDVIDGGGKESLSLRRIFKEKWVKPRGQIDEVFKGNETEVFWNDVPLTITEYQKRVNDIIPESVFKMLSNPYYFPTLDWKLQRDMLFQLAGTVTDEEIASTKPEYAALMDKISGKSLTDFKREIGARKKKLKDELSQISPKIAQTHKLMPEKSDFAALEAEIERLDKEISDIDEAIADKTKAIRQQYSIEQAKQKEINELKSRQQAILNEAKTLATEAAYESNAMRRDLENNIKSLERETSIEHDRAEMLEGELKSLEERLASVIKDMDRHRENWHMENDKKFEGDEECFNCGQKLPESHRENAQKSFVDAKLQKLNQITDIGKHLDKEAGLIRGNIIKTQERLKTSENDLNTKSETLADLKQKLEDMPIAKASEINTQELPLYVELDSKIKELESELSTTTETVDTSELQAKKREISEQRDAAKNELSKRDLIERYKTEIEKLTEEGKKLAQQIADAEREEHVIQNFTKAKIDESEQRINRMFETVTFQLFNYNIDDSEKQNPIETCVPLVKGVPFTVANTAGQVNAGLDIINVLTRFHGVSVPIFIDNRESVDELFPVESQIINIIVKKGEKLSIN